MAMFTIDSFIHIGTGYLSQTPQNRNMKWINELNKEKPIVYLPKPSTMYVELRYTKSFSPAKVQYFFEYTK